MKKIIISVFVVLLIGGFCFLSMNSNDKLEERWDFVLPENVNLIYSEDTGSSFFGDGIYYEIYEIKGNMDVNDFDSHKNTVIENTVEERLKELEISSNMKIDFTKDYYYKMVEKNDDTLFLFYFPHYSQLYIIQDLY